MHAQRSADHFLAAGNSSRLGEPKQLKSYRGKTLVEHMIAAGKAAGCSSVVAILGSNIELIKSLAENAGAKCVGNEQWSEGMGSSIAAGVKQLALRNMISIGVSGLARQALRACVDRLGRYLPWKSPWKIPWESRNHFAFRTTGGTSFE